MKEWKKPELTILTRSEAAESVLGYCKNPTIIAGPNGYNANCQMTFAVCDPCSTVHAS